MLLFLARIFVSHAGITKNDSAHTDSVSFKAGLCQLGSRGGSLKKERKKKRKRKKKRDRETGNHSVRVGPNLPGQVGAPLEHTAHHQNLTNIGRSPLTEAFSQLLPRQMSEKLENECVSFG